METLVVPAGAVSVIEANAYAFPFGTERRLSRLLLALSFRSECLNQVSRIGVVPHEQVGGVDCVADFRL